MTAGSLLLTSGIRHYLDKRRDVPGRNAHAPYRLPAHKRRTRIERPEMRLIQADIQECSFRSEPEEVGMTRQSMMLLSSNASYYHH